MPNRKSDVTSVPVPLASRVNELYETTDLADAFSIALPEGIERDPELLARFFFAHQPTWVAGLMKVRDTFITPFGLKTSRQLRVAGAFTPSERIDIFKIYQTNSNEVIMGEDDKHLDFRVSVLYSPKTASADGNARLILSTVVQCHNLLGRTYIALIAPFHRLVVQSGLRRAAHIGWPKRAETQGIKGQAYVARSSVV